MDSRRTLMLAAIVLLLAFGAAPVGAHHPPKAPEVKEIASFAAPGCTGGCGSGSTVAPDGALYVTDPRPAACFA